MNSNPTMNLGDYYNRLYKEGGPKKLFVSINPWVIVFGPGWFFYRKMFKVGFLLASFSALFTFALWLSPLTPAIFNKPWIIYLAILGVCSLYADWMYLVHVSKLRKLNKTNITYGLKYGLIGFVFMLSLGILEYYAVKHLQSYKAQQIDRMMEKDGYLSVLLLKAGIVDVNFTGDNGVTLVFHASRNNLVHQLAYLAKMGADLEKPTMGIKPLYAAAIKGHLESVRILLEHGAQVNGISSIKIDSQPSPYQFTALNAAIGMGYFEISKLLIESGADVNCSSKIRTSLPPLPPLYSAILKNDLKAVQLLVENGADINHVAKFDYGTATPLAVAVQSANLNMVKLLLKNKADLQYTPDNTSSLALRTAKQLNKKDIEEYLIAQGAK